MKSPKSKVEERAGDVVDMEEAIALLKTTRQTFYRWLRSGKLKGMKVGRQWRFYKEDVERFLKGEGPRVELPGSLKPFLSMLEKRLADMGKALKTPLTGSEDLQAVWLMILAGYHMKASDLHLEPQVKAGGETKVMLRYRIDGVLSTICEFDLPLLKPIIERWKIMGNANIHETTKPQDCRIQLTIEGAALDMRVCLVPACLGESLTCRFLDPKGVRLSLDHIPYSTRDREAINHFLASPWGLMFVTGPQGSGKTTVLYSCLQQCAGPERKVMSVEDPVEYLIPWVTQMQIRPADGLTYVACMRSTMRCDPDVVMVGEIRDTESLRVAQQMALTGHLIMSTLHAESTAAALVRLCEMGGDPFLVADSTRLMVSQRLVRKVCPECAQKVAPGKEELAKARELARAGGLDLEALPKGWLRRTEGCAHCRMTGYRGRTVMAEVMEVTREIGTALRQRATVAQLQALAVSQGMTTMAADGIRRAAAGETTLEEVFRIIPAAIV
jgi:general secretion pathway protein E